MEPAPPRRRLRRWLTRGFLSLLAVVVVGSAVSYATTGKGPIERAFNMDKDVGLNADVSGYGLSDVSVMEPMTEERLDEVPDRAREFLLALRMDKSLTALERSHPQGLQQLPGNIAGYGETETEPGGPVSVVSINGQICAIWLDYRALNCGKLGKLTRDGLLIHGDLGFDGDHRVIGFVDDDIASVRLDLPDAETVPVEDNVFELTGVPNRRMYVLLMDENGEVIGRNWISRPFGGIIAGPNAPERNESRPPPEE